MTLFILWFVLITVLQMVYLILEGFDLDVGILLPFVAKGDHERTQTVCATDPRQDGDGVRLPTAGGATFAAFSEWYATIFSGMYLALFPIPVCLVIRVMAPEWRSKVAIEKWRYAQDWAHTISTWLVPVLLGVVFANFIQGMRIEIVDVVTGAVTDSTSANQSLATAMHQLTDGFFSLLTPYTTLDGLATMAACLVHGVRFLALKTTGKVHDRADTIATPAAITVTVLVAAWLLWGQLAYTTNILVWIPLPVATLATIASTALLQASLHREGQSFVASSVATAGTAAWVFTSVAPAIQKSSINSAHSLTISQASSAPSMLAVVTIVAVCLLPIVPAYVFWSHWMFRAHVGAEDVEMQTGLLLKKIRVGESFFAN